MSGTADTKARSGRTARMTVFMMIVALSGLQTECCGCRRKACFYTWKKARQIKEFFSQGRNLRVNKHYDLFPKLCFRQTSALCYVLCVRPSAEWCWHVEQKIAPAAVLWTYQSLINQAWHVLQTHSLQSILVNLLLETFIHSILQTPFSIKQPFLYNSENIQTFFSTDET